MSSPETQSRSPDLSLTDRVQRFIAERFLAGAGLATIEPDASLLENGVIDSTGVLEFIEFLEEAFQIKIRDEELVPENLDSINKAVAFVERKTASQKG